jgi:Vacuolar sorting 38 and autophagy-related subunit 14
MKKKPSSGLYDRKLNAFRVSFGKVYPRGVTDAERQRLENMRGDVATRKSNLASALKGIKASHTAGITSLKAEISRVREKREHLHQRIAIARRSRCKEVAELLSLKRISIKKDSFSLAGIALVDFHLIRSISIMIMLMIDFAPMYVVLGLTHATHLLTLLTDHLSLKPI